ncbi:DUF4058 family protein [Nodosilinea sp. LEGE 07088]|nr:DUF4058 family protein [Nodosilinea sp. LEGE 07088]MBE9141511.1 DUF4058 family protein [Nodosilinea sp. LEGE 07088]
MPSPFPEMNPYLENPELWPEVHSRLIVAIADALNPQLMPKYRAAIDQRVYDISGDKALLIGISDVTVGRQTSSVDQNPVAVMPPPPSVSGRVTEAVGLPEHGDAGLGMARTLPGAGQWTVSGRGYPGREQWWQHSRAIAHPRRQGRQVVRRR